MSVIRTAGLTVIAAPVDPAAVGAVTTSGATAEGTARIVTAVVAGTLLWPWSSVTVKVTVRTAERREGRETDCSRCSYAATEAAPVNVSEFVPAAAVTPLGSVP